MQVSGASIGETASAILKNEGVASFWKGLPFAFGRELSYTSIKLGAYAPGKLVLFLVGTNAPNDIHIHFPHVAFTFPFPYY
jgi:hypothetical protein